MGIAGKLLAMQWAMRRVENWPALFAYTVGFGQPIRVNLRGGPKIFLSDRFAPVTLWEVYGRDVYRPPVAIPSDGTVVDLGANIGIFTLLAARQIVPQGRVIALEPNPQILNILRRNLQQNGIHNVEVREGAVGVGGEAAALRINESDSRSSILDSLSDGGGGGGGTVRVQLVAPKEALRWAKTIDLLKVDCEGGEHPLLYESSAEDWRHVRAVVMEYHSGLSTGYPSDGKPELLVSRLQEFGFATQAKPAHGGYGIIIAQQQMAAAAAP